MMTATPLPTPVVDWARFNLVRRYADRRMQRLLSYYREDAERCTAQADLFARRGALVPMIGQLEQLRRDSVQLGALGVAELAETIENEARDIIDHGHVAHTMPLGLPRLRSLLKATLADMEAEIDAGLSPIEPAPQTSRSPNPRPAQRRSSPA